MDQRFQRQRVLGRMRSDPFIRVLSFGVGENLLPALHAMDAPGFMLGGENDPALQVAVVPQLLQVLQQTEADSLKDIGSIVLRKSRTEGNAVDQALIPQDQRLPCLPISSLTAKHKGSIRMFQRNSSPYTFVDATAYIMGSNQE